MVTDIRSAIEFEAATSNSIVVVYFYANYQIKCREDASMRVYETTESKYSSSPVKFYKMDIETVCEVAEKYNLDSVPMVCIFKNGKRSCELKGCNLISENLENNIKNTC